MARGLRWNRAGTTSHITRLTQRLEGSEWGEIGGVEGEKMPLSPERPRLGNSLL